MKKNHLSTDTPATSTEDKLDKQLEDSFPTSDPPSYSPGSVGAPKNRESDPHGGDQPEAKEDASKSGRATKKSQNG